MSFFSCRSKSTKPKHQKEKEKQSKKQKSQKISSLAIQPMQQPEDYFYESHISLPANFAERILNLEMDLESTTVSMITVNELVELYRIGVEYFESIKSDKYMIFKNKTQTLFMRPNVYECMNRAYEKRLETQSQTQTKPSDQEPEKNQDFLRGQKQKELQNNLTYVRQQDQRDNINIMIQQHGQEQKRMNHMIQRDLTQQTDTVQQRLERRKMSVRSVRGSNKQIVD